MSVFTRGLLPLHEKRAAEMLTLCIFIRKGHSINFLEFKYGHFCLCVQSLFIQFKGGWTSPRPGSETASHGASECVQSKDPMAWSTASRLNECHLKAAWKTHSGGWVFIHTVGEPWGALGFSAAGAEGRHLSAFQARMPGAGIKWLRCSSSREQSYWKQWSGKE